MIYIKRVYEPYEEKDGYRILVDRLWPRGVSKENIKVDIWIKDIAPSDVLRKWFAHDVVKWNDFKKQYIKELEEKKDQINQLKGWENEYKTITLLYGAADKQHNQAVILLELLQKLTL